jgi:hypothetical protein
MEWLSIFGLPGDRLVAGTMGYGFESPQTANLMGIK